MIYDSGYPEQAEILGMRNGVPEWIILIRSLQLFHLMRSVPST